MSSPENQEPVKGSRYKILDKIGEGGMGEVYHVVDLLNKRFVALKQVRFDANDLNFASSNPDSNITESQQALSNEFSILASLRHPNIVSVLDYGFDESRQPYFVMDLLESPQMITEATENLSDEDRTRILIQLLQALDYLHHRGIVHRDLKPANVLVDHNTVKVLDFGLALATDFITDKEDDDRISGTLAYIAPEVLRGEPATLASDLYAFGVIMYEVYKGEHPFDHSDTFKLIYSITNDIPDYQSFDNEIAIILGQLLGKDPLDRYTSIDRLIDDLCSAKGVDRPSESIAIRESYLQAATFVGRDDEFSQLEILMSELTDKKSASRLIAGESGVGKSRLLNEFRVRALIEDIHVFRGQAVAEGAIPFKVWHDVLRYILLYTEVDADELSVLKHIIPNVEDVLGYTVAPVPELSAQAMKTRLIDIISELLKRQSKPLILIMEDLHWADQASIEAFAYISRNIEQYPVLLLGSYRSDEMPDLPTQIPDSPAFELQRLTEGEIAALSVSMLGKVGADGEIIAFLQRETAGNIFFAIEILRMWAHEAGDLRKIADMPIPDNILAGGILAVLRKRIDRLSEEQQRILMQAAVFGRDIDQDLIQAVFSDVDIDAWLLHAHDVAIIEVFDENWRFVHDKVREYLLHELKQDTKDWQEKQVLAANTIESLYPDNPAYIPALAHHYSEAEVIDKAVPHLEQAAELVQSTDYQRTVDFIQTILSYGAKYPSNDMQKAKWHAMLSTSYYLLGDDGASEQHLQHLLRSIDAPGIPDNNVQAVWKIGLQLGRQVMHRLLPGLFVGKNHRPEFDNHMYLAMMNAPVVYSHQGKTSQLIYSLLLSLNTVEAMKPTASVNPAMAYGAFTLMSGMMNMHGVANHYYGLTEQSLDGIQPILQKQSLGLLGFYHAQRAEWEKSVQYVEECLAAYDKIGDVHNSDETRGILGRVYGHRGQLDAGYQMLEGSYHRAKERRDEIIAITLYLATVSNLLHSGQMLSRDFDDLSLLMNPAMMKELFPEGWSANSNHQAGFYAAQAAYSLHLGEVDDAYEALEKSIKAYATEPVERPLIHFDLYCLVPQTCISLLRLENETWKPEKATNLREWAKMSLAQLGKFAKIHSFARPRYSLLSGYVSALDEQTQGIEQWQEALNLALEQQMPYDAAQAHAALYQATGDENHQRQMQAIVDSIGIDATTSHFVMMK